MARMSVDYWRAVQTSGMSVPTDRPLPELTAELTNMLGSTDPGIRDGLALPTLATWIDEGVFDDLLVGLGDGMAAGLAVGLGELDTTTVFRRSFSALVLAECIARDNEQLLVPAAKVLEWGDRLVAWLVRERDVRGFVPEHGWAHAVAHGADAIGVLAGSPRLGPLDLTVLLDVLCDRLLTPARTPYDAGEADRLALATMAVLRRDEVPTDVVERWLRRIQEAADPVGESTGAQSPTATNAQSFLRALHLQLVLGPRPPADRSDLLLVMLDSLRATNVHYLR